MALLRQRIYTNIKCVIYGGANLQIDKKQPAKFLELSKWLKKNSTVATQLQYQTLWKQWQD